MLPFSTVLEKGRVNAQGHALRAKSNWGGVRLMVVKSSVGHVDDMLTAHGRVATVWAGAVIFGKDVMVAILIVSGGYGAGSKAY